MPNPLNVPITPPRVAFIDPRSGTVSREWYLFFLSLFQSQGGSSISLDDVQKGPPSLTVDELHGLIRVVGENLAPAPETSELQAELDKVRQELQLLPRQELGTMAALQQDNVPWLQFDTTPSGYPTGTAAAGTLYWDDADGIKTLNLVMEDSGSVVQQIGEETYYRIKADAAITNGQVVMFTGTVGASGALKGAPATGLTAFQNEYIMGVATQDIALNGWGYVTWFGLVRGINTTGGAEAWVDGQILYYNPAVPGGLTKNVPTAPNPKVIVASVVNAASNGSLFVRPTFGSALGSTDSNVQIGTLVNGNLLIYNASTSRWENATLTAGTNVTITNGPGSITIASSNPGGTVTSVGLSAPTGFSVSGSPVTTSGTLALSFAAGYSLPTTASQTNWDTAYSERQQWDGGSTNLVAATGRTSLGATTVGSNLFTLTNPSAITFLRVNADNTVSALSASAFRTAIGAGTGDGTVTSVQASGGTTGLTFSGGPITTSGTLTLAGTLTVANGGTGITSFGSGIATWLGTPSSANLASAVTDETGSGLLVFNNTPTLTTPVINGMTGNTAAWTFGTTQLIKTTGGFFGFGVSPSYQIDVLSALSSSVAGNNTVASFSTNGAGLDAHIRLNDNSSAAVRYGQLSGKAYLWTNGAARLWVDTSGNVLVNRTSQFTNEKFGVLQDADGKGFQIRSTSASLTNTIIQANAVRNTTDGTFFAYGYYNDTAGYYKFYVRDAGDIYSTSTSITAISDVKCKENIRLLDYGLDEIMSLTPRRFDWKQGEGNGKKNVAGFIAQEVQPIMPDIVDTWTRNEKEADYLGIRMTDMIPTIVRAIQELKSEIDAIKSGLH